jgi:hypothetical protein
LFFRHLALHIKRQKFPSTLGYPEHTPFKRRAKVVWRPLGSLPVRSSRVSLRSEAIRSRSSAIEWSLPSAIDRKTGRKND